MTGAGSQRPLRWSGYDLRSLLTDISPCLLGCEGAVADALFSLGGSMCDFDLFEPEPGDADYVAPTKREKAKVVYRECSDLELFEPEPGDADYVGPALPRFFS